MKNEFQQKIAVVGIEGLPLALAAAEYDDTIVYDQDEVKIAQLSSETKHKRLKLTATPGDLRSASIVVVCSPVSLRRMPDFGELEDDCEIIAKNLLPDALVILESRTIPGAAESIALSKLEKVSGRQHGELPFAVALPSVNAHGEKVRIVGAINRESLSRATKFYERAGFRFVSMRSILEVESARIAEESFAEIAQAFSNELTMSSAAAGVDFARVLAAARIRMPFLREPSCVSEMQRTPSDPYRFIRHGRTQGFEMHLLREAQRIQNGMPFFAVRLLIDGMREARKPLKRAKVALLGLELAGASSSSGAREIEHALAKRGASVRSFDPHALYASSVRSLDEALQSASAAIVAHDDAIFRKLSPSQLQSAGVSVIVDGCNSLDKEKFTESGIVYRGIGR